MVSHAVFPSLDPALPVSLSSPALSWLRRRLGFEGIILTDDVNMKAVSAGRSPEEAAVMAVAAGADMIMYLDERGVTKAHAALVNAVREERLPLARLDEAVERILEQKLKRHIWNTSRRLIEEASSAPALGPRLREFVELKKEGDALTAALR
jgi:beta-glucosidase-like glycosyl hydrolase